MFNLMFQHRANVKHKDQGKYKRQESKRHTILLTQFGDKHTYSGGLPSQEEIHYSSPSSN
jgi:hypothetical protein